MALLIVGAALWEEAWGFWAAAIVLGGFCLLVIAVNKINKERKIHTPLALVCLLLGATFYFGAPVAAWVTWGHLPGAVYGFITIVGLGMVVRDAVAEVNAGRDGKEVAGE